MAKRNMSENSLKNLEKGNLANKNPSERKEIARKGAEVTNAKKAARKTLKEELALILENGDVQNKISLALVDKALGGDIRAFEVIRDTIGEKPRDVIENVAPPIINIEGLKI